MLQRLVFCKTLSCIALFALAAGGFPTSAISEVGKRSNIAIPTMGGRQFWRDKFIHAGWRIQQNVYTKHHRLLDPDDTRHAWGTFEEAKAVFEKIKKNQTIEPANREMVILVHGILPLVSPFPKMERFLRAQGYDVFSLRYPSTRGSIEAHAAGFAQVLDQLIGTNTVHFVTHSMGGLVVRHLLAADGAWKENVTVGRVVMIAPPNQGSAVARLLKNVLPYELILGRAGQQLTPEAASNMPLLNVPFTIIAGGRNDREGFNPFLEGDDDGTVKVSETKLAGSDAHYVVPAIHATVAGHPETLRLTLEYLKMYATISQPGFNTHSRGGEK